MQSQLCLPQAAGEKDNATLGILAEQNFNRCLRCPQPKHGPKGLGLVFSSHRAPTGALFPSFLNPGLVKMSIICERHLLLLLSFFSTLKRCFLSSEFDASSSLLYKVTTCQPIFEWSAILVMLPPNCNCFKTFV